MALRDVAAADLRTILTDTVRGFGWTVTLTSPDEVTAVLAGFTTDISQMIDPQTGMLVSGRSASVALPIATINEAFPGLMPEHVAEKNRKPWRVTFTDTAGNSYTFKVATSNPDRAIGVVVLLLEIYKVAA